MLNQKSDQCLRWVSKDISSLKKAYDDLYKISEKVEVLINQGELIKVLQIMPEFEKIESQLKSLIYLETLSEDVVYNMYTEGIKLDAKSSFIGFD